MYIRSKKHHYYHVYKDTVKKSTTNTKIPYVHAHMHARLLPHSLFKGLTRIQPCVIVGAG